MTLLKGGNSPTAGFTERGRQAAEVLGPGVMLWLSSAGPQDAVRYPGCVHLVRLDNWAAMEPWSSYIRRVDATVQRWRAAVPRAIFVPGNEPDLEAGHHGEQIGQVAQAFHARYPGSLISNVPLSVEATAQTRADGCDVVVGHAYFERQHPEDLGNPQFGAAYRHLLPLANGRPVYVSEFNVVQVNCPIDWPDRNQQVAQWMAQAETDGVAGVCLFILDGGGQWASFDVGPEAAQDILNRIPAPAPPPPPVPPPAPPTPDPAGDWVPPSQGDSTVGDPPRLFLRSDYGWRPMTIDQYYAVIDDGSFAGTTEPMRNVADYNSLVNVLQPANIDPFLPLAFTKAEGHDLTDPGLVAGKYNNPGGIKYSGAAGTYDTGIATDTGGTYAGFNDLTVYFAEWVRIMNNSIIGPDFNGGNLYGAVEHYTNGPRTGWAKVTFWWQYRTMFPSNSTPVPGKISGDSVADQALTWLGDTTFTDEGVTEPSLYRCEEFVEVIHEELGIPRVRWFDAVQHGRAVTLITDPAQFRRGMVGFWDGTFFAVDGHTSVYNGDGTFVGAGSTAIDVSPTTWLQHPGFMGMTFYPGVGETTEDVMFTVDGKIDDGRLDANWFGSVNPTARAVKNTPRVKGHGIPDRWEAEFRAGRGLGAVQSTEMTVPGAGGAVIQYFSSGWIVWYPDGSTTVN